MKRLSFPLAMLALVLAFGLAFLSCDDGSGTTGGGNTPGGGGASRFTLTNIPSQYNGKYVFLQGGVGNNEAGIGGFQNYNTSTGVRTLVSVSNGSASIPLWTGIGYPYTGTEAAQILIAITDQATIGGDGHTNPSWIAQIMFYSVPFTNGSATRSWSQADIVQ